jgi:serine/threonine-protein kinase
MPYVRGESLRERLRREIQLPIAAAVELAQQVALALDHAHREGVIHRDLKPENILLSEGQALVADFGIAKALAADDDVGLTGTGIVVGKPAYKAPEHAAGGRIDLRSDIYALGCVLYEMLAGEPPYTGPTAQAVTAKRLTDPVPSVRRIREEVPEALDQAIRTALAKSPADRFPTAAQFATALARPSAAVLAGRRPRKGLRVALLASAVVALGGLGSFLLHRPRPAPSTADDRVVMILPFRVTGADPRLAYLREGMVDLLAAKLTGDGGPRSVDPRSTLSAWHRGGGSLEDDLPADAALAIARRLGAGRLIEGSVVGTPERLVFTASVLKSGTRTSAAVSMEGPLDSLSALVDGLTARLLTGEAGEGEKLGDLTSTSLPALRAYLEGRSAYRFGRYDEALQQFRRAVELDSTFALAGLGIRSAALWTQYGSEAADRGIALAWAARDRLSKRDRLFLIAAAGPRYPARSPLPEQLSAWEQVVEVAPDQPESQYELGDVLFHSGPVFDIEDSRIRAARAFGRALELDSTFSSPLYHLVDLAAMARDTGRVRTLAGLYLSRNPHADAADYIRWRASNALGDTVEALKVRARFERMSWHQLEIISQIGQYDGIGLEDVRKVQELVLDKADSPFLRRLAQGGRAIVALNQGRPLAAAQTIKLLAHSDSPDRPHDSLYWMVLNALYWDGDTISAVGAVKTLARFARAAPGRDATARATRLMDMCIVRLWSLGRHRVPVPPSAITLLRAGSGAPDALYRERLCAALLMVKASPGVPRARNHELVVLDSLARTRVQNFWVEDALVHAANLELARVAETQGDLPAALRILQRRIYFIWDLVFFSTSLREEGRIAAIAGDRDRAIRAYQHYLGLRSNPEPSRRADFEQVRDELAKLLAEAPR